MRIGAVLIAALVVGTGVYGAPGEGPERYIRRFTVQGGEWMRESQVSPNPQQSPFTVMWEVTLYPPGSVPTAEQRKAADDLVKRSYQSAEKNNWFDFDKAAADGYRMMFDDDLHYANETYILDDAVLDPGRPEFLMYYPTREGKKLAGYMFLTNEPRARGPQIDGPLIVWHYHTLAVDECFLKGLLIMGRPENGECARGVKMRRTPEMVHVWLIDHPAGHFATQMGIDRNLLAELLDRRYRERGH